MIIFNLEYSILDKLGRAKSAKHVGLFKTEEDVNYAKLKTQENMSDQRISFQVYIIEDPFFKVS